MPPTIADLPGLIAALAAYALLWRHWSLPWVLIFSALLSALPALFLS